MTTNHEAQLARLEQLEATIAKGLATYKERNELIVSLVEQGVRQADVARRINKVRAASGVATVTPDAVAATMRRVYKEAGKRGKKSR